jgi:hypothetical protein
MLLKLILICNYYPHICARMRSTANPADAGLYIIRR